jgi:hypothetical protein
LPCCTLTTWSIHGSQEGAEEDAEEPDRREDEDPPLPEDEEPERELPLALERDEPELGEPDLLLLREEEEAQGAAR